MANQSGYLVGQIDSPQAKLSNRDPEVRFRHQMAEAGQYGFDYIADTVQHNLDSGWYSIEATSDTVIAAINGNGVGIDGNVTLKSGTRLKGYFTMIKLTSGTVVAYLFRERNAT